jgi:hypothetical protein
MLFYSRNLCFFLCHHHHFQVSSVLMPYLLAFQLVVIRGILRASLKMLVFYMRTSLFCSYHYFFFKVKAHEMPISCYRPCFDQRHELFLHPQVNILLSIEMSSFVISGDVSKMSITMINRPSVSSCRLQASRKRTTCCWKLWCYQSLTIFLIGVNAF